MRARKKKKKGFDECLEQAMETKTDSLKTSETGSQPGRWWDIWKLEVRKDG